MLSALYVGSTIDFETLPKNVGSLRCEGHSEHRGICICAYAFLYSLINLQHTQTWRPPLILPLNSSTQPVKQPRYSTPTHVSAEQYSVIRYLLVCVLMLVPQRNAHTFCNDKPDGAANLCGARHPHTVLAVLHFSCLSSQSCEGERQRAHLLRPSSMPINSVSWRTSQAPLTAG